ncbi:MAG: FHA domain-containing protein [Ruminococcus sp.]|nr:FHA domain-containing protein [Ruminococcus sp.]
MVKKTAAAAAAFMAVSAALTTLDAGAFSVEQIQAEMPDITVYYSGSTSDSVEVMLDHEKLEISEPVTFEEADIPVFYHILIDDSGSVTRGQLEAVKTALNEDTWFIRPSDRVELVSVGTLETFFSGSITDENYKSAVGAFTNDKQETFLYEALDGVSDEIFSSSDTSGWRNVIIAFSDGFNEAVGKSTYSEVTDTLKENGVPLYAMGMAGGYSPDIDSFGELARSTGGDIYVFGQNDTSAAFQQLADRITGSCVVKAKVSSNVTGMDRLVTVSCPEENYSGEFTIHPLKWIPDTSAPEIISFDIISGNQFEVSFSEDVIGADDISNYIISRPRSAVELVSAVYTSDENGWRAVLTASERLYTADYTLSAANITDNSNEKNHISEPLTKRLKGEEPEGVPSDGKEDKRLFPILIIAGGALALVLISAVLAVLALKKKKPAAEEALPEVPEKSGPPPRNIALLLENGRELRFAVSDKLTVGRSQNNDVFFDDMNMSRSHFVIENSGGRFVIKDCGSMSGTSVNGEKINENGRELFPGDVISAGRTEITVRW